MHILKRSETNVIISGPIDSHVYWWKIAEIPLGPGNLINQSWKVASLSLSYEGTETNFSSFSELPKVGLITSLIMLRFLGPQAIILLRLLHNSLPMTFSLS